MSIDSELKISQRPPSDVQALKLQRRQTRRLRLFEPALVHMAVRKSFVMLDPRSLVPSPALA